jgi:glycosyltransferase involved in cell wall biosynthesis
VNGNCIDIAETIELVRQLGLTDDQVQFLGPTEHAQTIQLLKTAHAFASWVTGPYPALGMAPMEAMLCETPVVNDLPENLFGEGKLKNGENIVLVNFRDLQSIAAALVRLLQDSAWRQRIGPGGRRFVLAHHRWPNGSFLWTSAARKG